MLEVYSSIAWCCTNKSADALLVPVENILPEIQGWISVKQ